ncbi:hypothetical protein MBRA_06279 [Methylobacterium brachiatum]|nr:hypothetical protein MBRA_06279 [Methylobacterium brachiatum]
MDKYGPSALMERGLGRISMPPAPSEKPTLLAYALVGALGVACILGAAGIAGVIPGHGLAMTIAGTTAFTLLNPHFAGLHSQVPEAVTILSFLAPATLFTVNSRELWKVTRLPPEAGRVIAWLLRVAYDGMVGLSRLFSALKPVKPLKRLRGLLVRLRLRRAVNPAV